MIAAYPFKSVRWSLQDVPMTYYGPDLAEFRSDMEQAA